MYFILFVYPILVFILLFALFLFYFLIKSLIIFFSLVFNIRFVLYCFDYYLFIFLNFLMVKNFIQDYFWSSYGHLGLMTKVTGFED